MILLVQTAILLNKIISADEKPKKLPEQYNFGFQQFSADKEPSKKFESLKVPDLDPFSIAPNLKKPPKSAGGLGDKTDQNDPWFFYKKTC